nr:hypothetical protein [Tanacetum cinerariifolium]
MGEPLSPNHVFDFLVDEPEPHPAYDFFAPRPLPGYVGNPNNNNGWIEANVHLLGELEAVADKLMVSPIVDEIAGLILKAKEQVNDEWLMAPVTPPLMPAVPPPSVYEVGGLSTAAFVGKSCPFPVPGLPILPSVIEDLSTRLGNLEYGHGQLVKKVIQVQVMASQMVHAADRFEQIGTQVEEGQQTATQRDEVIAGLTQQVQALQTAVQQRDTQIQQLQTIISELSSRESTLMQCILRMDRPLIDLERIPPGPQ